MKSKGQILIIKREYRIYINIYRSTWLHTTNFFCKLYWWWWLLLNFTYEHDWWSTRTYFQRGFLLVGWRFFSNTEIFWFKIREKERCVHGVVFRLQNVDRPCCGVATEGWWGEVRGGRYWKRQRIFSNFLLYFFLILKLLQVESSNREICKEVG